MLQTALEGLKTAPSTRPAWSWLEFLRTEGFHTLLQSPEPLALIEAMQERAPRGAPSLWERGVKGPRSFPSGLGTVIEGFP